MYRLKLKQIFVLQRQIKTCNLQFLDYRSITCAKFDSCQKLRTGAYIAQNNVQYSERSFATFHPLYKNGNKRGDHYSKKRNTDKYSNKPNVPRVRKTETQMPLIAEMLVGNQTTLGLDEREQHLKETHSHLDEISTSQLPDNDSDDEEVLEELEFTGKGGDSHFDGIEAEVAETQDILEMSSYPENEINDENIDYVEDFSLHSKYEMAKLEKDKKRKKIQTLFGGPDPTIPMSETPCSGCGAIMHCQDPGIPGKICL